MTVTNAEAAPTPDLTEKAGPEYELPDMTNVIIPPPDIRKIADRIAKYTAKNDKALEDKIREQKRGMPQFSFLNEGDPYYNYYISEKQRVRLGVESQPIPEVNENSNLSESKPEEKQEVKEPPTQPPPFQFIDEAPHCSPIELDVIKTTALYIARNGPQFRSGLIQRERGNYQFDFLRPGHHLFPYFSRLCEMYIQILNPNKETLELLEMSKNDKFKMLERVMQRVEYSLYEEEQRKIQAEKEDKERAAFAAIDWHDFVVVQTLEFTLLDKKSDLPPPMTIQDIINQNIAERKAKDIDRDLMEMQMEMNQNINEPHPEQIKEEERRSPSPIPIDNTPMQPIQHTNAPIKIKQNYVPKIGVRKEAFEPKQVCPICKLSFPASEIDEHIRIESLDPKWKEQKDIYEARNKDSNLLKETTDISKNLKNLVQSRPDVFGNEDITIAKKLEEEKEKRKQAERENPSYNAGSNLPSTIQHGHPMPHPIGTLPSGQPDLGFPPGPPPGYGAPRPFVAICPPYVPPPGASTRPPIPPPANPNPVPPFQPMNMRFPPPPPTHGFMPPPPITVQQPESNQPGPKRIKLEGVLANLVPEHQWIEMNPSPLTIVIPVPENPAKPEWGLNGQTLKLTEIQPSLSIGDLKELIAKEIGLPANKQKITVTLPFKAPPQVAKNDYTLATYNLTGEVKIALGVKERGGKK